MNNSHDPLSVLHGDELPVQPDPAFAGRLRARLESAANFFESQPNRTQGVVMSGTSTAIAELNESAAEPAASAPPRPAALPYLSVANAREAIHATEALLVRARRAFRSHYPEPEGGKS